MSRIKSIKLIYFILIISFSCSYDMDDRVPQQMFPEEETIEEGQFVDEQGSVYITGSTDCTGTGSYILDSNNLLEDLEIPDDLPIEMDLSEYLPPIGNQGRQGSCVSWSTTYYLKSLQKRQSTEPPYDEATIMSPAYTYNQITEGICESTGITSALSVLKSKGTVTLEEFPYFDDSCSIQPTEVQDILAEENKILDFKALSRENMVNEIKTLINDGKPILISVFLDSEFAKTDDLGLTAYRDHIVDFSIEGGCHAMLIVGYDNENNAFKVVNSWGENWGDDGFVWIDYIAFDNVADETADFRVISSAYVAFNE
ncbi:C1 family peptidase [Winogradskyella sp. PG-2]|uniref:C1 family peptidase n=1 Tax=Winogradskyella sp. PG-2 TaxID=754409 RepID=UPI0005ED5141|nr:C1 family peptidase [Winogradskyella sp. PG-2]